MKFKIGDRVIYRGAIEDFCGKTGIVVFVKNEAFEEYAYGVRFVDRVYGHSLNGLCPEGNGWWCRASSLTLAHEDFPALAITFDDVWR